MGPLWNKTAPSPKPSTGKDGPGSGSSEMEEAEEEFRKSISDLISSTIMRVLRFLEDMVWH